jgi:hypothetical protein
LSPTGALNLARTSEFTINNTNTKQRTRAVDLAEDANRRWCLLTTDNTGAATITVKNENITAEGNSVTRTFGPYAGWQPVAVAASPGADQTFRLLWRNVNGTASVWRLANFGAFIDGKEHGPFPGWNPIDVSMGLDIHTRLLWRNDNGAASVWALNPEGFFVTGQQFGPYAGWAPRAISTGLDSRSRLLWNNTDTRASLWTLDPAGMFVSGTEYLP